MGGGWDEGITNLGQVQLGGGASVRDSPFDGKVFCCFREDLIT